MAGDDVRVYSAGSQPSGKINLKAVASMKEMGYDLTKHHSKSLNEIKQYAPFDVVVTMGCGDACPWMPEKKFIDWEIPDPKEMDESNFRRVRDLIKDKVSELLASL
jgi:arsenate reductase (thioredoxin)